MDIHHNLEAIKDVALHYAKEHNDNYNVIISNPINGEFGDGSTYEFVTDSYFEKERNCVILMKTDDVLNGELPVKTEKNILHVESEPFLISNIKDYKTTYPGMSYGVNRPRIEPRTVERLPGRNDKCKCGSEKKFKKCCLK